MVIKNAATGADVSAKTEIRYPEADETPLPDGFYQLWHFVELNLALKSFFRPRDDVVIAGNVFIYYWEGEPQIWVAPDCFVVMGVSLESFERNDTYLLWEVGKAPDFVLEIGSPSSVIEDLGWKRDLYARLGVVEYWMFDPSGGEHYGFALRGETLVDGEYRELEMVSGTDGSLSGHSAVLNLELHWREGRLRFYDPVGRRWLENMEETGSRAEFAEVRAASAEALAQSAEALAQSAEARAEAERAARDSAEARARAERERAERLEARLRALQDDSPNADP